MRFSVGRLTQIAAIDGDGQGITRVDADGTTPLSDQPLAPDAVIAAPARWGIAPR